jgi:hypothetical protein
MKKAAAILVITVLCSCSNTGDNHDHDTLKDTARDIASRIPDANTEAPLPANSQTQETGD